MQLHSQAPRYQDSPTIRKRVQLLPDVHDFPTEDPQTWRSFGCTKVREVVLRVDEKVQGGVRVFLPEQPFTHGFLILSEYRSALSGRGCPLVCVANFKQGPPFAVEDSRQGSGDSPRPRAEANDPIRLNLAGFEGRQ